MTDRPLEENAMSLPVFGLLCDLLCALAKGRGGAQKAERPLKRGLEPSQVRLIKRPHLSGAAIPASTSLYHERSANASENSSMPGFLRETPRHQGPARNSLMRLINSLIARFNSLFDRNKFPVSNLRELCCSALSLLLNFWPQKVLRGLHRRKFPVNSLLAGNLGFRDENR